MTATAEAAVTARGLTKSFGGQPALDGLDLDVASGSVHGLLGLNGAGKSTLLRVLLGLVRPDAGTVRLPPTVGGFVETPGAYPYLTGRDNLALLASMDDRPGDVDEVLRRVGLHDRADTRVGGWSLGMRQRLGIAAGLLRRPDLLVLDEPANGLDPQGARALRDLVADLAEEGLTVLLCSHDLAEVDELCDQVTVVAQGRRRWTGAVADLRGQARRVRMHTSDDVAAVLQAPVELTAEPTGDGFTVAELPELLDTYVLRLAAHGIAVRHMAPELRPLERAFSELAT